MIDFLKRHRISITFAVLLLAAVLVISSGLRRGRTETTGWPQKILLEAAYPFQKGTDWFIDSVRNIWTGYIYLVDLRKENRRLRRIIHDMKAEQNLFQEEVEANKRLRRLLQFEEQNPLPKLPAQVIGWDASSWFRSITIDRGTADGVSEGMVVTAVEGLAGHVQHASAHTSQVLLIVDHNSAVSAIVRRTRSRGIVVGKRLNRCQLKYLEQAEEVHAGDEVITSGLDGRYPKGLMIGLVTEVQKKEQGLFQQADVKPLAELNKLEEVFILLEKPKAEAGDDEVEKEEEAF